MSGPTSEFDCAICSMVCLECGGNLLADPRGGFACATCRVSYSLRIPEGEGNVPENYQELSDQELREYEIRQAEKVDPKSPHHHVWVKDVQTMNWTDVDGTA